MVDSYEGEVTEDGKFTCFASREILSYIKECGLDFPPTIVRSRLLFSNDEIKKAGFKASKTSTSAKKEDKFTCFITHVNYLIKPDIVLEFKLDNDSIFISRDGYVIGRDECIKNKEKLI